MDLLALLLGAALIFGACWLGCGLAAFFAARARGGNPLHWAAYGFFLGPFALVLAYKLTHPCPHCQVKILRGLRTCPACTQPIPQLSDEQNPKGSFWSYRRSW
ncbi:MAG: hypothetical protein HYW07_14850 [Candidatus Latescibacteria bacterium]|nr:hypothetical protein [Candidatus Latescibacterota bacterium]